MSVQTTMPTLNNILLEQKVVYDPSTHSLYKINDINNQVALAIPASRCFFSLLEHQGKVVSHADLLQFVWGSRGMMVSPNTLYQNMSILRKTLGSLEISDEIIKTVPKRGFIIPSGFPVQFDFQPDNDTHCRSVNMSEYDDSAADEAPVNDELKASSNSHRYFFASIFLCVFFLAYLITNLLSERGIPQYIAPEYSKLTNIQDCYVYRNNSEKNDRFFKRFLSEQKVQCGKEKWWYLTNYPPSPQVSFLRCSNNLSGKVADKHLLCISDFYSETNP